VRKVLGLYAASRDEICIGVGSLEVRAVGRIPINAGSVQVCHRFSELIIRYSAAAVFL